MNGSRRTIVVCFFVAVSIATWYWMKKIEQAPPPSAFVGSGMVYGGLAVVGEVAVLSGFAATLAVAWTLGLWYAASETGGTSFAKPVRTARKTIAVPERKKAKTA